MHSISANHAQTASLLIVEMDGDLLEAEILCKPLNRFCSSTLNQIKPLPSRSVAHAPTACDWRGRLGQSTLCISRNAGLLKIFWLGLACLCFPHSLTLCDILFIGSRARRNRLYTSDSYSLIYQTCPRNHLAIQRVLCR